MNQNERARLDRIEEKIDKLCDAVVSIARAEEKIHNYRREYADMKKVDRNYNDANI